MITNIFIFECIFFLLMTVLEINLLYVLQFLSTGIIKGYFEEFVEACDGIFSFKPLSWNKRPPEIRQSPSYRSLENQ